MCWVCSLGERCSFIWLKYMDSLKVWNQAHSLVWFIPPWTIRIWGFLQQRAVCTVHCIECNCSVAEDYNQRGRNRVALVLFYSWIWPCCYWTFLDIFIHFTNLYMLVKHQSLEHWNLPWQNQIALTDKLFFTNRKKLSKCILLRVQSLLPSRPMPTDQDIEGHWVPRAWLVGGLLPRALSIA